MSASRSFSASIRAWGAVRLALPAIAPLRKKLPAWVPQGTAGHFLKYADEQTVAAVAAVDGAIQSHSIDLSRQRDWAIIAAPRFLGRVAGPSVINGYTRGGPQAVSPQVIPQHSLHSISGALSILLGSRGPNVGVGGGPESLDDAILAAFSLPGTNDSQGCWLIATSWSPEPVADLEGRLTNEPVCHAMALALQFAAQAPFTAQTHPCGELCLQAGDGHPRTTELALAPKSAAEIVCQLESASSRGDEFRSAWRLAWGGEVQLRMQAAALPQRAAA
jgi:hypothetical protein